MKRLNAQILTIVSTPPVNMKSLGTQVEALKFIIAK
jgi:hypothetical protein